MYYEMEELIPIVGMLAEKYTAFQSTSVTYETAGQLMEAVLYCIHELELSENEERMSSADLDAHPVDCSGEMGAHPADFNGKTEVPPAVSHKKLPARQAYEAGLACVENKTKRALELYHEILPEFVSYGNHCLHDTFIKGIPEFFKWYDVKFNPQNTILTLDYPVLKDISGLTGIDRIYEFLKCIRLEQQFLKKFPEAYVVEILENYARRVSADIDSSRDLVENLCEIVLTTAPLF